LTEDLRGRGIRFRSLNEGAIDTPRASGELIFNIFSALAQFARRVIQERTKARLAAGHVISTTRAGSGSDGRELSPPFACH
jgi:DNA invertase Pin-like site-specific DNA recombinase